MGIIWMADVTNKEGETEKITTMERRTGTAWGAGERNDYNKLRKQIQGRREETMGLKGWTSHCKVLARMGMQPVTDVNGEETTGGGVKEMDRIEAARTGPDCWGGWEYKVTWKGGKQSWVWENEMEKDEATQKECGKARREKEIPSLFIDVVQKDTALQRACRATGGATGEDMTKLWRAFIAYAECTKRGKEGTGVTWRSTPGERDGEARSHGPENHNSRHSMEGGK
jgi:hypothetical protein